MCNSLILESERMTDDTPRHYKRKPADKRVDVAWNPPATRAQPVHRWECVCQNCGRHFVIEESLQPTPPKFCLEGDLEGCHEARRRAYYREYRAKKRAEAAED